MLSLLKSNLFFVVNFLPLFCNFCNFFVKKNQGKEQEDGLVRLLVEMPSLSESDLSPCFARFVRFDFCCHCVLPHCGYDVES